jgi:tetratricopeptide (TPR) repeat protein
MTRTRAATRPPAPPAAQRTPVTWAWAAGVAVVTVIAFLPTLENGFVNFDDDRLLLRNPYLRLHWPEKLRWIFTTRYMGHYQPLTWLSLATDSTIAGLNPTAYHVDSLLWHVAAALLLYALLLDLLERTDGVIPRHVASYAAAGALFWSVHPLRVESVAWIAERRDPVSTVFLFLALIAYLRSVNVGRARLASVRWYWASCLCLLCSVLAKAWGLSFFITVLALDVYPLGRLPLSSAALTDARYRAVWLQKLPLAAIGLVAGAIAWGAQHDQPDTMLTLSQWPLASRLLQAGYGVSFYVWKTIWPSRLAVMYELPGDAAAMWRMGFVACLAVATLGVGAVVLRARTNPGLFVTAVVYLATLGPVLGLAQSGPQLVADRYAYVSCVPFSALLTVALMKLRRPAAGALLGAACISALAAMTWRQSGFWRDSQTLWSHALAVAPPSYVAHLNYGQSLRAAGRLDAALAQYRLAITLRPDAGNGWYNLANALKASGDIDGAEAAYRTALSYLSWKVDAQVNLGNLYYNRRQLPAAIEQYRAATATLSSVPAAEFSPEPFLYLGMALADNGDREGARAALNTARRYDATRARADQELDRLQASAAGAR